ncbi:hypothetical protein [Noviherbaspirillum sp.]|uniref:hypothetical protein n=1 Tax=Noviherbaspirillum sp. TaxID=1926288 RepID=UPI002FE3A003
MTSNDSPMGNAPTSERERLQEQLALLRLIDLGRKEYQAGNFTEAQDFFAEFDQQTGD